MSVAAKRRWIKDSEARVRRQEQQAAQVLRHVYRTAPKTLPRELRFQASELEAAEEILSKARAS